MWKIGLAFVMFAAVAMFVVIKGGDAVDMGGEKHGSEVAHGSEAAVPASAPSAP